MTRAEKERLERESFNAGFGKAVELIGKVATALPSGVPDYCKGGALAHLGSGYAVLHEHDGEQKALEWLRAVLTLAAADATKATGGKLRIVVELIR